MIDPSRKQLIASQFKKHFNTAPTHWVRAPGRVDLMGSHTDYNMGFVVTMAVDRDTWISARPREDRQVKLRSMNVAGVTSFNLDEVQRDSVITWGNYVRGVALYLEEAGYPLTGFDGVIHSTVPFGSGLSSSAALEMAVGNLFQALGGYQVDPVELARIGQEAENQFVGVSTGILDQYSSTMGQAGSAILLDCRALTSQPIPIPEHLTVMICDTRAKRNLTGTEYDTRRSQCESGVALIKETYPEVEALRDVTIDQLEEHHDHLTEEVYKRCLFIIQENQRVLGLAEALTAGDDKRVGQLLTGSYRGARDLYEISCPELDAMAEAISQAPATLGGRIAGAGFGGCMVALVRNDSVEGFTDFVQGSYQEATRIEPMIYPVVASPPAGILADG